METFYLFAIEMLPLFDSDNMTNMVVRGINVIKMNLVEMIIVLLIPLRIIHGFWLRCVSISIYLPSSSC